MRNYSVQNLLVIIIVQCFLITANYSFLFAQRSGQERIDSLNHELKIAGEDTSKVRLLINLSEEYKGVNNEKSLEFLRNALALSEKIGWERGKGLYYYSIAGVYREIGKPDKSIENIEKAEKIFKKLNDNVRPKGDVISFRFESIILRYSLCC